MLALLKRLLDLIARLFRRPPAPPPPPPRAPKVDLTNYDAGTIERPDPRRLDFGTILAPEDPRSAP